MSNIVYKPTDSDDQVVGGVAQMINQHLERGHKVLWLIAGGSAIKLAVRIAEQLHRPLEYLTITLTDERYGEPGHPDSNWQQLQEAGFSADGATLQPVLNGRSMDETAALYAQTLDRDIAAADYSFALAGMGADGHIFGIKPGSPSVSSDKEVVDYEWSDYNRITPTIKLIKRLDQVVLYAKGEEKWPQFENLAKDIDPNKQPAQLLKQLKKVTVYTDYKGEKE